MIDRQELIAVLDRRGVLPAERHTWPEVLAFREELADAILVLDKPPAPDVTVKVDQAEPGMVYGNGKHYPKGEPAHPLSECNQRECGPKL